MFVKIDSFNARDSRFRSKTYYEIYDTSDNSLGIFTLEYLRSTAEKYKGFKIENLSLSDGHSTEAPSGMPESFDTIAYNKGKCKIGVSEDGIITLEQNAYEKFVGVKNAEDYPFIYVEYDGNCWLDNGIAGTCNPYFIKNALDGINFNTIVGRVKKGSVEEAYLRYVCGACSRYPKFKNMLDKARVYKDRLIDLDIDVPTDENNCKGAIGFSMRAKYSTGCKINFSYPYNKLCSTIV